MYLLTVLHGFLPESETRGRALPFHKGRREVLLLLFPKTTRGQESDPRVGQAFLRDLEGAELSCIALSPPP